MRFIDPFGDVRVQGCDYILGAGGVLEYTENEGRRGGDRGTETGREIVEGWCMEEKTGRRKGKKGGL